MGILVVTNTDDRPEERSLVFLVPFLAGATYIPRVNNDRCGN
jgi:hypothetical protein